MNIMPVDLAASLAREPLSIEESLINVGKRINFAVINRRTSVKIPVWFNVEAVVGALLAMGYEVSHKTKETSKLGMEAGLPEVTTTLTVRW
jgi:hypothetical protein